jgi:uncharacterized protein (DUF2252 family)
MHSRAERRKHGEDLRANVALDSFAAVPDASARRDALSLLHGQDAGREQDLVPLRYQRMGASAFAFLRGSAIVMASDLSLLPTSGITVQLCGDAHIANFGMFASAERDLVFDVNDFDETLPGPFDWDVRRLAASAAVATLSAGHSRKAARKAARESARLYRQTMAAMAQLPTLDAWYVKLDVATLTERVGGSSLGKQLIAQGRKAGKSTAESAAIKLTEVVDGRRRFRSDPPLVVPLWDVADDAIAAQTLVYLGPRFKQYLVSLEPDRAALLRHFEYVDIARKVVGVGSVGTRAGVVLLESGDGEPLLLQMKQASASVLEPHLGASQCATHSERVVVGQRVMQASGDPFLGWVRLSDDGSNDFYVRQLRDMKASVDVAKLDKNGLIQYAGLCGAVLARAHARVGDSSAISGYLGDTDEFDKAIADFALAYADVNDQDYRALVDFGKQTGS